MYLYNKFDDGTVTLYLASSTTNPVTVSYESVIRDGVPYDSFVCSANTSFGVIQMSNVS